MPESLRSKLEEVIEMHDCPDCGTELKFSEKYTFKQCSGHMGPSGEEEAKCKAVLTKFVICQKCYDVFMNEVRKKRVYIRVFRRDNDIAKNNGAKLDWKLKIWYIAPYATPMQRRFLLGQFQEIDIDFPTHVEQTKSVPLPSPAGRASGGLGAIRQDWE